MLEASILDFAELKNIYKFNEEMVSKDLLNRYSSFFIFYYVKTWDWKILIYKVNSPDTKYEYSLELFLFFFANNLLKRPPLILKIRLSTFQKVDF